MKKYFSIGLLLLITGAISSCEKKFLERKPLDSFSDADVWSDIKLVEAFVNSRYTILPFMEAQGVQKAYFMSGASDEGYSKHNYGNEVAIVTAQLSPENRAYDFWAQNYEQIRNLNIFLSKIDQVPVNSANDEALKKRLLGEVKFLRAYGYFDLLQHYGGVPLVTKVYGLSDTSFKVKRNTIDECVQFIVADIDSAVLLLPVRHDGANTGRATAVAAKALKSRLLLYAASPLFNPGGEASKWGAARDAAKDAIEFAEANGHALYQHVDYKRIFLDKRNPEILMAYNFSNVPGGGIDIVCQPNSYGGWSVYTPSQAIIDAFEMNNGKFITDPTAGYDPAHPFNNREPRFYADVLFNGATFKGKTVEVFGGGKDSPQGPQGWNATNTGYHWRKYMDESFEIGQRNSNQNWIISRLAELYLNYAEALYETGNEALAREYVNKIRTRASVNLPAITETGAALRDRIRHERRIELCFESHRIYDVRRWKIAPQTESQPLRAVRVTKSGSDFTYEYFTLQQRAWNDKLYFWPISRDEMNKNDWLVQNQGYN
jgi:starch-binding outer membrane protein, SusD/RagB family